MRKSLFAVLFLAFCSFAFAQQAMNNDAVVKLVKAGLSEDVILATVNASPGTYDTSANGLIALKQAGVSDQVIAAIVSKGFSQAKPSAPAAQAVSTRPAGIDDVGVYYKDKTGAWVSLLPEVVNFKSGGVLKSLASAGVVKGDINGHLQGAHAKLNLTFPVVLAVYVPEGTDITEYQFLRLHTNNDSREFRSVTGGIMHTSGGAVRDMLEYQTEKLAPRVFQITLQAGLGKGEFGLLPPGAGSSNNLGSSGKIYAVSIIE